VTWAFFAASAHWLLIGVFGLLKGLIVGLLRLLRRVL
jgi:hypothetical protein